MKIGTKICKLRKERDFTQKEVADFLGVSDKAVSKWETGESYPDIELIPKIAKLLGTTTDYLLRDDMEENKVEDESKVTVEEKKKEEKAAGNKKGDRILNSLIDILSLIIGATFFIVLFRPWFQLKEVSGYTIMASLGGGDLSDYYTFLYQRVAPFLVTTCCFVGLGLVATIIQLAYKKITWLVSIFYVVAAIVLCIALNGYGLKPMPGTLVVIFLFMVAILDAIPIIKTLIIYFRNN